MQSAPIKPHKIAQLKHSLSDPSFPFMHSKQMPICRWGIKHMNHSQNMISAIGSNNRIDAQCKQFQR